jgi:hypothetical protein
MFGRNMTNQTEPPSVYSITPQGQDALFSHANILHLSADAVQRFTSSQRLEDYPVLHDKCARKSLSASRIKELLCSAAQFIYDVQPHRAGHVVHMWLSKDMLNVFAEANINTEDFNSVLNKRREGRKYAAAVMCDQRADGGVQKSFEILEVFCMGFCGGWFLFHFGDFYC